MGRISDPLKASYALSDGIVPIAIGGVSEEDAHRRARETDGPSIAWALGHVCQYRAWALGLLGRDATFRYEGAFGRTADDGAAYPALAELRAEFVRLGEALQAALSETADTVFEAPVENDLHGGKTLLDQFMFYPWHEAYHMGQLSSLRSALGYKPTAQVVMEAAAEKG